MSSRESIIARIRAATTEAAEPPQIVRDYLPAHAADDPDALIDLLAKNLTDYRAHVHHATDTDLPAVLARLLAERGSRSVAVPAGRPAAWLGEATGIAKHDDSDSDTDADTDADGGLLTARDLDAIDSVVTGCRLAIAETGTLVLDTSPGQGRRALTLVPDHHVCVVRTADQIVASLPQALPRLDPRRPLTWISGPSATSDIELDRVEGVHGPRRLDVVLVR